MSKKYSALTFALLSLAGVGAVSAADKVADKKVSTWTDVAKLPNFWTGTWGPAPGAPMPSMNRPKPSFTKQAQAYVANYKSKEDIAFGAANCKTPGMPMVMQIVAMPLKFMVEPALVAIYLEGFSQTRFIRMDRPHADPINPTYLGDSIGRWEGNTLVIDSVGFVDDIVLPYGVSATANGPPGGIGGVSGPHGPDLRMVERIRLVDADTMEIKTTLTDPTVWTAPQEETVTFKRLTGPTATPMEWVCTESINYYDPVQDKHITKDPEEVVKEAVKK